MSFSTPSFTCKLQLIKVEPIKNVTRFNVKTRKEQKDIRKPVSNDKLGVAERLKQLKVEELNSNIRSNSLHLLYNFSTWVRIFDYNHRANYGIWWAEWTRNGEYHEQRWRDDTISFPLSLDLSLSLLLLSLELMSMKTQDSKFSNKVLISLSHISAIMTSRQRADLIPPTITKNPAPRIFIYYNTLTEIWQRKLYPKLTLKAFC